jgi:hypothetical protein
MEDKAVAESRGLTEPGATVALQLEPVNYNLHNYNTIVITYMSGISKPHTCQHCLQTNEK